MITIVLSMCAFGFTIFSFWWMNWRPGRLVVASPRAFGVMRADDSVVIVVPLVLVNTGARPVIVQNLRLLLPELEEPDRPFVFMATRSNLKFESDYTPAVQFPVRSTEATPIIGEFFRKPGNVVFQAKTYTAKLQGLIHRQPGWRDLCTFELRVPVQRMTEVNQSGFATVDNAEGYRIS